MNSLTNEDLQERRVLGSVRTSLLAGLCQHPGDSKLLLQLIRLHRALGDLEAAAATCEDYLRHHPDQGMERLRSVLQGHPVPGSHPRSGPAPFLRLANVLPPEHLAAVWSALEEHRRSLAPATVQWHGRQGVVGEVRRSMRMKTPAAVLNRLVAPLRAVIEERGLTTAFSIPRPLSGEVESETVCHVEAGRFGRHTDDAYGSAGRALTCVYYLHLRPAEFQGGDLLLHDSQPGEKGDPIAFTRFAPEDNTAVIFPSDVCHEVTRVRSPVEDPLRGRVSVNVWFHAATKTSGTSVA